MKKVKTPKFTNGELSVIRIMVSHASDIMKGGTAATKKDFASLSAKVIAHETAIYTASEPKKQKPLTKKAIKDILKSVIPKDTTDRGDFLVKLQNNINTAFN